MEQNKNYFFIIYVKNIFIYFLELYNKLNDFFKIID